MNLPDRFPLRRPFDHGSLPQPARKRLTRAEAQACTEIVLHELDMHVREQKSRREVASSARVVAHIIDTELEFYDSALDLVGASSMKQRRLADRLALLVALNDDTAGRYRR